MDPLQKALLKRVYGQRLDDPYDRVPRPEGFGFNKPVQPDERNWQQKARDKVNKWGLQAFGPHSEALFGGLGAAAQFTDAADLSDAMTTGGEMGRAIEQGDYWGATKLAPWMLAATGAAMMPGVSMGGIDNVAREASEQTTKGIRAYHGSPHSFDKFSMDKIGTGEGAQAYGHGLYFADSEGVARSYRDALSTPKGDQSIADDAMQLFGSKDDAIAYLEKTASELGGKPVMQRSYANAIEILRGGKPSGSMYEVNINADPESFLDWDAPLSAQPESVKGFAGTLKDKSFLARKRLDDETAATGRDVWEKARNAYGVGKVDEATAKLREAGIPGIKYLDAGSRAKGDGSRNYVVFDDKLIEILRKYGLAGLIPAGIGAASMSQDQDTQY